MTEQKPKLFRVWHSDGNDNDETCRILANNIDDAVEYVKKTYFKQEYVDDIQEDGDDQHAILYWTEYFDEHGNPIDEPAEDDDEPNCTTFSYSINEEEEYDEEDKAFHTIYGSNDFVDLIHPENSGKPLAKVLEEYGTPEKAFFAHGGKGFEAGNPENNYNLGTSKPRLWNPEEKQ